MNRQKRKRSGWRVAAAAFLSGSMALAGDIVIDGDSGGEGGVINRIVAGNGATPDGKIDYYGDILTAENNSVEIRDGATVDYGNYEDYYYHNGIAGGYANSSNGEGDVTASNNRVTMNGGTVSSVNGGYARRGAAAVNSTTVADGNDVTINNGLVGYVYGGHAYDALNGTVSASNNRVIMNGGEVTHDVNGGRAYTDGGSGSANNNSVIINGGSAHNDKWVVDIYGGIVGYAGVATANNNIVRLYDGIVDRVVGGYAIATDRGEANGNLVEILGGVVKEDILGGWTEIGTDISSSSSANANNNTVILSGGEIHASVFGGRVTGNNYGVGGERWQGTATNNTVTVNGAVTFLHGFIHGGGIANDWGLLPSTELLLTASATDILDDFHARYRSTNADIDVFTGNQLNFETGGKLVSNTRIGIADFEFINFNGGFLSVANGGIFNSDETKTTTLNFNLDKYAAGASGAILTVGAANKDISKFGYAFAGGDGTYNLIKTADGVGKFDNANAAKEKIDNFKGLKTYTAIISASGDLLSVTTETDAGLIESLSPTAEVGASIAEQIAGGTALGDALQALQQSGGNAAIEYFAAANNPATQASAMRDNAGQAVQNANNAFANLTASNHSQNVARQHLGGATERAAAGGKPTDCQSVLAGNSGATGAGHRATTGFVKAYGGFGSQGSVPSKTPGYDFSSVGVIAGVGRHLTSELELGGIVGYSHNRADIYQSLGNNTDDLIRLGVYGNYEWDNIFFNTAPTFGIHLFNTERADGLGGKARSDRTGLDFSWYNRIGCTAVLPGDVFITPSYALALSYLHDPAYTEYGSLAAQKINDYDNWSLLQNVEVKVGKLLRISKGFALLPEFWAGWEHEYFDPNSIGWQFAQPGSKQYRADLQNAATDRALLGIGITTLIGERWELSGRYDERLWDGGHLSSFTVGVGVTF